MNVVPCEFREAKFMHCIFRGYWFRIYEILVFLNGVFETHCFLHQSEMLDNACLLHEMGIACSTHSYEKLATDNNEFKEVFKLIEDYVSASNND